MDLARSRRECSLSPWIVASSASRREKCHGCSTRPIGSGSRRRSRAALGSLAGAPCDGTAPRRGGPGLGSASPVGLTIAESRRVATHCVRVCTLREGGATAPSRQSRRTAVLGIRRGEGDKHRVAVNRDALMSRSSPRGEQGGAAVPQRLHGLGRLAPLEGISNKLLLQSDRVF